MAGANSHKNMMDTQKHLDQQIKKLREFSLGLKGVQVLIEKTKSRFNPWQSDSEQIKNIFDVQIEVADSPCIWEFNLEHADHFPDVIFAEEDEEFNPDITSYTSLSDWDIKKDTKLQEFVLELSRSYVQYQKEKLQCYDQIKEEFQIFFKDHSELANECELQIAKGGQKAHTYSDIITFLVPIKCDCSDVPPTFKKKNSGKDVSYLHIKYESPNQTSVSSKLILNNSLISVLGGSSNLRIPSYGSLSLSKYVEKVTKLVQNTVEMVSQGYQMRRHFISLLIKELGSSAIVEYDTKLFLEACFMVEREDGFACLLLVSLTRLYSEKSPKMVLQSIYNVDGASKLPKLQVPLEGCFQDVAGAGDGVGECNENEDIRVAFIR
eukprot:TCONS_00050673-protein